MITLKKRTENDTPIEEILVNHPLWTWRAGTWVTSKSDPTVKGVITIASYQSIVVALADRPNMYFYKEMPYALAGKGAQSIEDARLLTTPATSGILMNRISSSPQIEEMSIRNYAPNEDYYITLFWDGAERPGGYNSTFTGKNLCSTLCAALLEVLNCEREIEELRKEQSKE